MAQVLSAKVALPAHQRFRIVPSTKGVSTPAAVAAPTIGQLWPRP